MHSQASGFRYGLCEIQESMSERFPSVAINRDETTPHRSSFFVRITKKIFALRGLLGACWRTKLIATPGEPSLAYRTLPRLVAVLALGFARTSNVLHRPDSPKPPAVYRGRAGRLVRRSPDCEFSQAYRRRDVACLAGARNRHRECSAAHWQTGWSVVSEA
jgi:hypothetical protein